MTKNAPRFPHTISYRLTDEDFLKLEHEVNETGLTLVSIGFQMLADDQLTTQEWNKIRVFAKQEIDFITDRTTKDFRSRTASDGRSAGSGR